MELDMFVVSLRRIQSDLQTMIDAIYHTDASKECTVAAPSALCSLEIAFSAIEEALSILSP